MMWMLCVLASQAAEMRWITEGQLLVNGDSILDAASGQLTPLQFPTFRQTPQGKHNLPMAISPSGQIALIDDVGEGILLGLLEGALIGWMALPTWEGDAGLRRDAIAALWLDDRQLLLVESLVGAEQGRCGVLDVGSQAWRPLDQCPPSQHPTVQSLMTEPRGWMTVSSIANEALGLTLTQWDPDAGARETLHLNNVVEQHLPPDLGVFLLPGGNVRLLAPCDLMAAQCIPTGERWLYTWLANGDLRFVRSGLPEGVLLARDGNTFLWMEDSLLCRGDPTGERRCSPVRTEPP